MAAGGRGQARAVALVAGLGAALGLAASLAAAQEAAPLPSPSAPLNLEQRMLLRCSAVFALGARAQEDGSAQASAWPPLAEAGREFFILASAQVMDEASLDRAAISARLFHEANEIAAAGTLATLMPVCLPMLDALASATAQPGA